MQRLGFGLLVTLAVLPGCVSIYQQPRTGEKSAQLVARMPRDPHPFSGNSSSSADIFGFSNAQCTPSAGDGRILFLGSILGSEKDAKVAAGRRLYLQIYQSETVYETLNGAQNALNVVLKTPGKPILEMRVTHRQCARVMSFEPEAGKTYDMLVDGVPDSCVVSLTDVSTDQAPPDLQEHAVEGACIPKY